jgi:hypothetical protein
MQITMKLKPKKMEAATKSQLLEKLRGGMWASSHFRTNYGRGNYLIRGEGGNQIARLYNLHKVRRKVEVTTRTITRGKNKGKVEKTINVLRRGHWVAFYYDVPTSIIGTAEQEARNFSLKLKEF